MMLSQFIYSVLPLRLGLVLSTLCEDEYGLSLEVFYTCSQLYGRGTILNHKFLGDEADKSFLVHGTLECI
jgi:hypothetical protein